MISFAWSIWWHEDHLTRSEWRSRFCSAWGSVAPRFVGGPMGAVLVVVDVGSDIDVIDPDFGSGMPGDDFAAVDPSTFWPAVERGVDPLRATSQMTPSTSRMTTPSAVAEISAVRR